MTRLVAVTAAVVWLSVPAGCGKGSTNDTLAAHSPALITGGSAPAAVLQAGGFEPDSSTDTVKPSGHIVPGPATITGFAPVESPVTIVNAADVSLRQILEDLGPDATLWYQHVQTLANPFFEGRAPETRGAELAAEYIEFYFRLYGLEPAFADFSSYRQAFVYSTRSRFVDVKVHETAFSLNGETLKEGTDYVVFRNSGSGEVAGPLSFVGYGIARGPEGYSSFDEDTDLSGRIALLLRYAPLNEDGTPLWDADTNRRHAALARKMRAVARRGAEGIVLVSPPGRAEGPDGLEPIEGSGRFGPGLKIPVVQITPEVAGRILREADPEGRDLAAWRRLADAGRVTTTDLSDAVHVAVFTDVWRHRRQHELSGQNVGGVLRGSGSLADEWIVIGAHHDHVGVGASGGVMPPNRGKLHPGADDNASGTAGVLILARRLSEAYADAPRDAGLRSVLFITFDGEEMGLKGSTYFAGNPTIDLTKTSIMLNMDMIGRLRSRNLWVLGTATGDGLPELLWTHFQQSGLTVSVTEAGSGRSDESNFQKLGVPALHFFTGIHAEYTSPADQAWTVNPGGAAEVLDLMYEIALSVASRPEKLAYAEPPTGPGRDRGYAPVRLGIRPAMGEEVEFGVLVDEVYEGTSAAEGGLMPGDIMIGWDRAELESAGDLFQQLQLHDPGDVVRITVLREDERIELEVTLKASRRRPAE
jgi:hypothetical protein